MKVLGSASDQDGVSGDATVDDRRQQTVPTYPMTRIVEGALVRMMERSLHKKDVRRDHELLGRR